jgi:hypothetical protein
VFSAFRGVLFVVYYGDSSLGFPEMESLEFIKIHATVSSSTG